MIEYFVCSLVLWCGGTTCKPVGLRGKSPKMCCMSKEQIKVVTIETQKSTIPNHCEN